MVKTCWKIVSAKFYVASFTVDDDVKKKLIQLSGQITFFTFAIFWRNLWDMCNFLIIFNKHGEFL